MRRATVGPPNFTVGMPTYITLENAERRHVIAHYHVMKCAGTTLTGILEREFGDDCYHVHRQDPRGAIYPEDLAAFLDATPTARALTSHHLRYPVPDWSGDIVDCCPVRRPLDRLVSLYEFMKYDRSQLLHQFATRGLDDFFATVVERYPQTVTNVQTAMLGMRDRYRPAGPHDLAVAAQRIRESPFIVLVDRFDESMVAAEHFLRPFWPRLRLHYRPHNVLRRLDSSVTEREREFRRRCSEETYRTMKRLNALDEQLCALVEKELERRIELVPSFGARLDEFRGRCAQLRSA